MLTSNIMKFRANIERHASADLLDGGKYDDAETGQTSFIGCQVRSYNPTLIEQTYGIPASLTRVLENVFQALPSKAEKVEFALAVGNAIGRDGKDLRRVVWEFLATELRALPATTDEVQAAIVLVAAGMDLLASGRRWSADSLAAADAAADAALVAAAASGAADSTDAYAARDCSRAAAVHDASAAWAIADATDACVRAHVAHAAADAALVAAAAAGAAHTARYDSRLRQSDTLLTLIGAA